MIGWKLDPAQREQLLAKFPPRYERAIADHVTLKARVDKAAGLPSETWAEIVGRGDDGRGVEAMVVRLGAGTRRPDGSTFHITWSLANGRRPVESNDVLARGDWEPIDPPVRVALIPAVFQ